MEGQDILQEFSKYMPMDFNEYDGFLDENGLRSNYGKETWSFEYQQKYKGGFLQDALHGRGKYWWMSGNKRTAYEGMFYANNLEGYGKFSYDDNTVFEGLFKNNIRFGPGVLTYNDGSQDVGLWNGKDLTRLCLVVSPEWIPRIARTPLAKAKLFRFKKLVSVCDPKKDRAREVLEKLGASKEVMKQSIKLYNVNIGNPKSHFFNTGLYDVNYFCDKHCYIDIPLSSSEEDICSNIEEVDRKSIRSDLTSENESIENICVCGDQKTIAIEQIRSELDYTEVVLERIREEVRKAYCIKKIVTAEQMKDRKQKGEPLFFAQNVTENIKGEEDLWDDEEEVLDDVHCNLTEEEVKGVDYTTACKLLAAAQSAEKLLARKKSDLLRKFIFESATAENVEDESKPLRTKKVFVTDLLAWNNEEISVSMLKHIFTHRNLERYMSFCISDLLAGNRPEFRKAGEYEDGCVRFLKECSNGNTKATMDLLKRYDLNPDLSDAKGNTGLVFAAARDKIKIIRILANLGANVDVFNDECFTPLGMCLTRYIATKEKIADWENAFLRTTLLRDEEQLEIREWRPHVSLVSISSLLQSKLELPEIATSDNTNLHSYSPSSATKLAEFSELFGSSLEFIDSNIYDELQQKLRRLNATPQQDFQEPYTMHFPEEASQSYVLNTDIVIPSPPPKSKGGKKQKEAKKKPKKTKESKSSKKSSKKLSIKDVVEEVEDTGNTECILEEVIQANKLNAIYETITVLLNFGANPNVCEVPLPSLILAVFTKDPRILDGLLAHNAEPNVTTLEEKLTALHVLVSLPPCEENVESLKVLLKYSTDPNMRADVYHWYAQKLELVANCELKEEDKGKTPFHLLAMRYDFILDTNGYMNQMAPILLLNGAKGEAKYLGHTPLSLAILRGNIELVRTLLETKLVNPNQRLGEGMGVPLAIYMLKRYKEMLPSLQDCQRIIELLVEFKANPFQMTEKGENLIDFIIQEHETLSTIQDKKVKGKKDKTSASQKGKKGKEVKSIQIQQLKPFLISIAKTTIEKHIKGYAVKYLYFFVEEEDFYDNITENMAKFITPEETLKIAQLLFYRGEIPIDNETNYQVLYDLLEFIINANCAKKEGDRLPSTVVDIDKMLENFEFKLIPEEKGKLNLAEPEAEKHDEKYNACFNCYRKKNCQLFICPDCNLVYYCSDACNQSYNKQAKPVHKCGTNIYNAQKEIHDERISRGHHWKRTSQERKLLEEGLLAKPQRHKKKPDPTRKLHLTRESKKPKTDEDKLKVELDSISQDSILSLRWRKEGSEFLLWKRVKSRKEEEEEEEMYDGMGIGKQKQHRKKGTKSRDKSKGEKSDKTSIGEESSKGAKKKKSTKGSKENKSAKSPKEEEEEQGKREKSKGKGKKKGGSGSEGEEPSERKTSGDRQKKSKSKQREKASSVERDGVPKKDKEIPKLEGAVGGTKSGGGVGGAKSGSGVGGVKSGGSAGGAKGDQEALGYVPMPVSGRILELRRRLPSRYQYFLEKISTLWPDLDLSLLFLPYACFGDGQLYYRFLSDKPIFMETYSNE